MTKLKHQTGHGLRRLFAPMLAAGALLAGATSISAAELTVLDIERYVFERPEIAERFSDMLDLQIRLGAAAVDRSHPHRPPPKSGRAYRREANRASVPLPVVLAVCRRL